MRNERDALTAARSEAADGAAASSSRGSVVRGIGWMLLATALFVTMHVFIRRLSAEIHPFEIAFFRNFLGIFLLAGWFTRIGFGALKTGNAGLHLVRAAVNTVAMLCFFSSLSLAPFATITALGFTSQLFAALGAVLFLGERFRLRRTVALVVGFLGVLAIVRPGIIAVGLGETLVLTSAVAWSVALLLIKTMSRTDSSWTITAYMNLLLTPITLVVAVFVWQWPSFGQFLWLSVIAVMGTLAQTALNQSLREAEVAIVMPFEFLRLVWAGLIGLFVFNELPGVWTWIGGAMIVASTSYIAYRESVLRRASPAET
ncbi:MAG: DMT family transporter [Alphaproteobacteria bacterium]|nr:DMT family transporter [Alphaproteobacteria bacterium]